MLILKILHHDLHRSRKPDASPFAIVVPDNVGYSPVLVSSTRGEFIVRRKLVQGGHPCGVFPHDPDRLDEIIGKMVQAAYDLSVAEEWPNVLPTADEAHRYIRKTSGTTALPANCLIPKSWTDADLDAWAGNEKDLTRTKTGEIYRKNCRLHRCNTEIPVFLSRPDFVGLFTSMLGGLSSVLLHNVKNSMAFCPHVPRASG
jgi:hypothetical protein